MARHPEAKRKNTDKFGYIKIDNFFMANSNDKQLGEIAGAYHREHVLFPFV